MTGPKRLKRIWDDLILINGLVVMSSLDTRHSRSSFACIEVDRGLSTHAGRLDASDPASPRESVSRCGGRDTQAKPGGGAPGFASRSGVRPSTITPIHT